MSSSRVMAFLRQLLWNVGCKRLSGPFSGTPKLLFPVTWIAYFLWTAFRVPELARNHSLCYLVGWKPNERHIKFGKNTTYRSLKYDKLPTLTPHNIQTSRTLPLKLSVSTTLYTLSMCNFFHPYQIKSSWDTDLWSCEKCKFCQYGRRTLIKIHKTS